MKLFARYVTFTSPLGESYDTLPLELMQALGDAGVQVNSRLNNNDDEGWCVTFYSGDTAYHFCARFDDHSELIEYVGWLEFAYGFWQSLLRPRETYDHRDLEPLIDLALRRLPQVRDICWHSGIKETKSNEVA